MSSIPLSVDELANRLVVAISSTYRGLDILKTTIEPGEEVELFLDLGGSAYRVTVETVPDER